MSAQGVNRKVDQTALKVNQAFIIGLLLLAFLLDTVWLVVFVAVVMLLGTAVPNLSLFKQIYQSILKPIGIAKPNIIEDNPEPHRFSQGLGGVFVTLSAIALFAGISTLGWALTWIVIFLAAFNLFLGFCAGCFIYYQLNKLGVPGFRVSPIQ